MDVGRTQALLEHALDRGLYARGSGFFAKGITHHHRRRQNGGQWIGDVATCDVGRRAVDRLVQTLVVCIQRRGRQHADRTGQHRRFIGKNVAEQVTRQNHVELLGCAHQLHGRIVHIHVRQLDIGVVFRDLDNHLAPQDAGIEYVGLVHRAKLAAALTRNSESHMRDAANFRFAVFHCVEAFTLAGVGLARAARLTEIDVAGQFAQDHDVEPGHDFVLQRRSIRQFGVQQRWSQIGEQPEFLANAQQSLLRTHGPGQRVVFRTADCAEQHGIGCLRQCQCLRRQRILGGVIAGSADRRLFHFDLQAVARQALKHLYRLLDDFGTDSVTGQYCDFHASFSQKNNRGIKFLPRPVLSIVIRQLNSQGCSMRRLVSNVFISAACCSVSVISSNPLSRQCLRNASTSKPYTWLPSA